MLTSTVALLAVNDDGFTLTFIFLSFESPGLQMKNLGRGNLSCIMNYILIKSLTVITLASSTGASSSYLKFS